MTPDEKKLLRERIAEDMFKKYPHLLEPYRGYETCEWFQLSPRGRKPYYNAVDHVFSYLKEDL